MRSLARSAFAWKRSRQGASSPIAMRPDFSAEAMKSSSSRLRPTASNSSTRAARLAFSVSESSSSFDFVS
jgi:hypothetical protein